MKKLRGLTRLLFITAIISCFSTISVNSQDCGTISSEKNVEQLRLIKESLNTIERRFGVTSVPVVMNVIRTDAGGGGLDAAEIQTALNIMNDYYVNAGIEFFLCRDINYINNSDWVSATYDEQQQISSQYDVDDVVNIYAANQVYSQSGSSLCGYAFYPGGPERVWMANSCFVNGSTLSHELGHFFGLLHTHGSSNVTNSTQELADGSNGDSTGDYMQDTPSDPKLSSGLVTFDCDYTGNYRDNNNQLHNPDPTNIMSYSRKDCRTYMSEDQYDMMNAILNTSRENLVCEDFYAHFNAPIEQQNVCSAPNVVEFLDCSQGAVSWEWDVNGDGIIDYYDQNPVHVYTEDGSYDVTLTIYNSSGDSVSKTRREYINVGGGAVDSETITLELTTDRWPSETSWTFSEEGGDPLHESPTYSQANDKEKTFTYTFDVTPGVCYDFEIFDSYGDGICCSSGTGSYKLISDDGTVVASGGDFKDSDIVKIKIRNASLGTGELDNSKFKIFPNPVKNILYISTQEIVDKVEVYNLAGQKILTTNQKEVDVSNLNQGTYIILIYSNKNYITRKFIK